MRRLAVVAPIALAASCALASGPDRDKTWGELLAAAKKRGATVTRLETTASYVMKRRDGLFVTFTWTLDGRKRAVCVVANEGAATACGDWDTLKLTYGRRAGADSPWVFGGEMPPDAERPGSLLQALQSLLETFPSELGPGASPSYARQIPHARTRELNPKEPGHGNRKAY